MKSKLNPKQAEGGKKDQSSEIGNNKAIEKKSIKLKMSSFGIVIKLITF